VVQQEAGRKLTEIYVDGDACPVREEIYRVATRFKVKVFVGSNGSRPIRPPGILNVSVVLVGDTADAADDWIAEHRGRGRMRHLRYPARIALPKKRSARRLPDRKTVDGSEYRQCACRSRDSAAPAGAGGNYPRASPLTQKDRSRFLSALDTALQAALRQAVRC
jgi:hypothetical protein